MVSTVVNLRKTEKSLPPTDIPIGEGFRIGGVNYRDDERRGLDVGVTPATLVREVVAGTPSIMGG